jgi:hypothetical protein
VLHVGLVLERVSVEMGPVLDNLLQRTPRAGSEPSMLFHLLSTLCMPLKHLGTPPPPLHLLIHLQGDGNLVLYLVVTGAALWSSGGAESHIGEAPAHIGVVGFTILTTLLGYPRRHRECQPWRLHLPG